MKKIIASALAAATLVGGFAVAGEASAERYGGGYHNGGGYDRDYNDRGYNRDYRRNDDGAALALGVLAGATLLGNGRVYANQGYGYGPPRGYYGDRYYQRRCWTQTYWDPYYGRVARRVCR
jgi:hypothetical protein